MSCHRLLAVTAHMLSRTILQVSAKQQQYYQSCDGYLINVWVEARYS